MGLIGVSLDDVIAQFLKDADLERHNWVLPRNTVQAHGGDARVWRLGRLPEGTAFFTCASGKGDTPVPNQGIEDTDRSLGVEGINEI